MLFDSSDTGLSQELESHKSDHVSCNDVAREAVSYVKLHYPDVHINMETQLADDFCIQTNRMYLMRALRELLYNSAKYSDGQHVVLRISLTDDAVNFIVEDTGKGISEADSEHLFKFFTKVDDLSEGLGLGLPLAKRHAQNLGGDIIFDPTYHDGCRFVLNILR
jgi:signal transduction histidine kinase